MTDWHEIKDSIPDYGDRVLFYDPNKNKCYQLMIFQDQWQREKWQTSEKFPFSKWKLWSKFPMSLMNDCPFPYVGEK